MEPKIFTARLKKEIPFILIPLLILNCFIFFIKSLTPVTVIFLILVNAPLIIAQLLVRRLAEAKIFDNKLILIYRTFLGGRKERQMDLVKIDATVQVESISKSRKAKVLRINHSNKNVEKIISGINGWDDLLIDNLFEALLYLKKST